MVFYNKILHAYVLIELKTTKLTPEAAGRINMYPSLWLMVIPPDPPYNVGTVDLYFCGREGLHLNRRYLTAVTPLPDYILQVDFVSGSRLLLDMKPYLDKIRFRPLADARVWNSAVTNGIFVRFGDVELSHDEILSMAEQEH